MREALIVSGLGAVSALGRGVGATREALFAGRDGIASVARFDVSVFAPVHLGASVPGGGSCAAWTIEAALEAWRDAGAPEVLPERIAIAMGAAEHDAPAQLARGVAEAIGARGPRWTVSTACASSTNAIGLGCDLIWRGDADVVVAGGADQLVAEMFAGFHRLGVLSVDKCAPFGATRGTTLGEGAGFVVLERAGRRAPWAFVHGYGLASDAWHETTPEPRGEGIARAMRSSLRDAGLGPGDIGYVNAHATGTAANDDAEWRGVQKALPERALPISGSKSFFGHAQSAAGALETIASLICMREGLVPPTLRVEGGRPNGPPDPVAGARPRAHDFTHALKNSSAFGGANAVLCFGREPVERARRWREVRVGGVGVVRTPRGSVRDEGALAADVDLRASDPSARMLLRAATRALDDGGVRVRGALRERAGLFMGASRMPPTSAAEFHASIEAGGLGRVSAAAFARIVLHAPAGAVSRWLSLRGPTTTLADPELAGLLAFAYAADWLARRDDADVLLAGGVEERASEEDTEEGAACVLLRAGDGAMGPRVAGSASCGPGQVDASIDVALGRAGRTRGEVELWQVRTEATDAPSFTSARSVVDAASAIREGAGLAVVAAGGASASVAVVLAT